MNNGHVDPSIRPHRGSAFASAAGGETSFLRTLRVLRHRKWILVLVWAGSLALAGLFAVTRPKTYRSDAVIEVGPETPASPADVIGELSGRTSPPWENHFRTQEALLRRAGLLRQVLDTLPPETVSEFQKASDPVRKLSEQVVIEAVPSTFLIRIAYEDPKPEHGPEIVNRLVELFIEDSNRRLRELKSGALEVLNQETLPDIRQKVEESEQRVQAFEVKTGYGDITERYASLLESKRRLADRLFEVRVRRIALRSQPEPRPESQGEAFPGGPVDAESLKGGARSLETLSALRAELEVELARQRAVFKEKHGTIIALREQLAAVNKLIQAALQATVKGRERAVQAAVKRVGQEVAAADDEERALMEEEKRLNDSLLVARGQVAHYQKLEAEVTASRDLYNSYLKKQAEVKAMSGAGIASVRVVDLAKTPNGHQRNTQLILTLGLVLGLLIGLGAVIFVEQNDDRAVTPHEAEAALGLDLLTAIPRMPKAAGAGKDPLVPEDDPQTAPLEPFRRLRSEVAARMQGIAGSKVVAVVGPGYGEGKTTVAVNLARTLGLEGRRVLLWDADFRRPRLKALFGDPKGPGLEEYLRSTIPLSRAIQATSMPGVDVLGASRRLEGSSELPGRARFCELWSEVRAYDFVIVDAGPVNAFSEVAGVASQSDASILVMDERGTEIRRAVAAKRILENHQIRILGLVVNRSLTTLPRVPEPAPLPAAYPGRNGKTRVVAKVG